MIKVDIYRNQNKNICSFVLKGHADYAQSGSDIVCSAVSLLVFNTINSIKKFTNENVSYDMDEKKGYLTCIFPDIKNNIDNHNVALLLDTMVFGLKSLELEYDKYIIISDTKEV